MKSAADAPADDDNDTGNGGEFVLVDAEGNAEKSAADSATDTAADGDDNSTGNDREFLLVDAVGSAEKSAADSAAYAATGFECTDDDGATVMGAGIDSTFEYDGNDAVGKTAGSNVTLGSEFAVAGDEAAEAAGVDGRGRSPRRRCRYSSSCS